MDQTLHRDLFNVINGLALKNSLLDALGVFFAEYLAYVLLAVAALYGLAYLSRKPRFNYFVILCGSVAVSLGITELIRYFYPVPRPFAVYESVRVLVNHTETPGFPSAHAAVFFSLAVAVFSVNKRLGRWFFAGAVVMGVGRIFVGVHWPIDIFAGMLTGSMGAVFVKSVVLRLFTEQKQGPLTK